MKKFLTLLLVLCMAFSLVACGEPEDPTVYKGEMADNGNTYADPNWMPVVKNPITITGIIRDPNIAGSVFSERTIWKEFAETTGVTIDLQVTTTAEPEQLMFASRNYPDVAFRIYVDDMQNHACYEGDIMELTDEMLEKYAPNWYNLFNEYPDIYKMCMLPDGKLYYLPEWLMADDTYMLRDCFWINETWLDELGLEMPKTTEDFLTYLRAVKAQAGTGSIPKNAAPLYLMCKTTNIGGYYGILDWFGIYNGFASEIVIDGKTVTHQALNENIKPAIEYLSQIYAEGLMNPNCTKTSWTEFQEATGNSYDGSETPWVGSFFAYALNHDIMKENFAICPPLDAGTPEGPYVHDFGAHERIVDNALCIFSHTKYPVAILRAFDHYATGEGALRAVIGEEGEDLQWFKEEDGKFLVGSKYWNNPENPNSYGWNDTAPGIITPDIAKEMLRKSYEDHDSRTYACEYVYKEYLPKNMSLFVSDALLYLTTDELSQCTLIQSKCNGIINTFVNKWITGKSDIDDEWDMFQMALKNSGMHTRLELCQKAWDLYSAVEID